MEGICTVLGTLFYLFVFVIVVDVPGTWSLPLYCFVWRVSVLFWALSKCLLYRAVGLGQSCWGAMAQKYCIDSNSPKQ